LSLAGILGWQHWSALLSFEERLGLEFGSLEIREGDFVADQSQVLGENPEEVADLLCREHSQLEQNEEQVQHAQNRL